MKVQKLLASSFKKYYITNQTLALYFNKNPIDTYDHFAYRSVDGIDRWCERLVGTYKIMDKLEFPEKKINALWFKPFDMRLPRIFVSELTLKDFPEEQRYLLKSILKNDSFDPPLYKHYLSLSEISDYAAWVYLFGELELNHVTVDVRDINGVKSFEDFNKWADSKLEMNHNGGLIKTSPDGLLHQSSTMAVMHKMRFPDSYVTREVPHNFVEFIWRDRDGFAQQNADLIFTSTKNYN